MKELSVEEKAKRYDEKLDVARHIYADPSVKDEDKYYIEVIFPELKESEDERIRKELIEFVKSRGGFKQEYIAWLEKQVDVKGKLVLTPEAYERILKLNEQKPAWSEEDECILNAINHYLSTHGLRMWYDWLKSLKDRVQPKQEWSEEDYNEIETIACHLDNTDNEGMAEILRNIRDKYYCIIPQNRWKPSDEQMNALRYVTNFDYGGHKATLVSLYEQLKKLK